VSFTGTLANATVGHGLGKEVDFILIKNRNDSVLWSGYHRSLGGTKYIVINSTNAEATSSTQWNNTDPTSSVFSVGTSNNTNDSGDSMIAYCFSSIKGFSKFGSYTGNGNSDGTFVYTGFKPAFVMIKNYSAISNWIMFDNKRDIDNVVNNRIFPNADAAQNTNTDILDFLSNGFKIRATSGESNESGATYIYMAFAEEPLVGDNPATAR
jgi:hypothetical protein